MKLIRSMKTGAVLLSATLVLTACGGSDDSVSAAPPSDDGLSQAQREDRAASASVAGLFAFAVALVSGATGEASEPRAIDGITPPAAEDTEPIALPI